MRWEEEKERLREMSALRAEIERAKVTAEAAEQAYEEHLAAQLENTTLLAGERSELEQEMMTLFNLMDTDRCAAIRPHSAAPPAAASSVLGAVGSLRLLRGRSHARPTAVSTDYCARSATQLGHD